ncbi:MAG: Endo-beta-mannanase [Paenibacillus sp.]|nr:Endo-beta-mannanase [Paenibacillus sp.]
MMLRDKWTRTIIVMADDWPGFDPRAADALCECLRHNGYLTLKTTIAEFRALHNPTDTAGFLLIVPQCRLLPIAFSSDLKAFATGGGQVLLLGGPLFYDWIEADGEGGFTHRELDGVLDATFAVQGEPLVIEGITPSYKTYAVRGVSQFRTEPEQTFYRDELAPGAALDIISPCGRIYGKGYNQERANRYIPLVHAMGEPCPDDALQAGRAEGTRGAAAFFMLSYTRNGGYRGKSRPGIVENTTIGSVAGAIGLTESDLLSVRGADSLLLSMVRAMQTGLFLFEGGVDGYRFREGERLKAGARILNASPFFRKVDLAIRIRSGEKLLFEWTTTVLCAPRHITDASFDMPEEQVEALRSASEGDLTVETELGVGGDRIDFIRQDISFVQAARPHADEFVTVREGQFYLKGQTWHPAGINYWPSYYPSAEIADYWCGFLDKTNYDPVVVEQDLAYMELMGINCLFTRLDGYNLERVRAGMSDFLVRCERHGMKVSLSVTNITCPAYYSPEAFRELAVSLGLTDNPALFCYDIAWEAGEDFMRPWIRDELMSEWMEWLIERYGSVERAESDWGRSASRSEDGLPMPPTDAQIDGNEDADRIMVAAYRRFQDDYVSGLWNRAVRDIRSVDPNHLITYRFGSFNTANIAFTATNKHSDFLCPEGYGIESDEDGYNMACFMNAYMHHSSGGKPIVWSEYGRSLCGYKWSGGLIWNHKEFAYYQEEIDKQTETADMFHRMMLASGVQGSAPWWWCGGFRLSEMADFGYIGPEGLLRPCGQAYVAFLQQLKKQGARREPDRFLDINRDAYTGGDYAICSTIGREAWGMADREGGYLGVKTAATGMNSKNVPLVAIGDVPCNGTNPPKYLNGEFNYIRLYEEGGDSREIRKGDTIRVRPNVPLYVDISAGNLQEAEWLAPDMAGGAGGVYIVSRGGSTLNVRIPIDGNTAYLQDTCVLGARLSAGIEASAIVTLGLEAEGRMAFGECFHFTLVI